jgi:hypothetical protein
MSGNPNNIELSPTGTIVCTSNGGTVLMTSTAFASYSDFNAGAIVAPTKSVEEIDAALVQPPISAPEPSTAVLAVTAFVFVIGQRWYSHRQMKKNPDRRAGNE